MRKPDYDPNETLPYLPYNGQDSWQGNVPPQQSYYPQVPPPYARSRPRRRGGCCCAPMVLLGVFLAFILAVYFLAPLRTNVLLMGVDYAPNGSNVSRSDTIILTTIIPLQPYVGMLSIPRDLWVTVPGYGENRINTAHFFAESQQPGSGPQALMETIRQNFGVNVKYYVRIHFEGFKDVVNALGGVDTNLPEPMAGYPAGPVHLTGNKALAFVRQRYGSDDFFRMEHGQFLLKAILKQMVSPAKWPRLPAVLIAIVRNTDTNLPVWQWPRLGLALLRAGPNGIDNRTITRDMASPYITSDGADVLLPDWNQINPVLKSIFGQ